MKQTTHDDSSEEILTLRRQIAELEAAQVAASRQHEAVLRGLLGTMQLGVHMYDLHPDGRLTFNRANGAAARILGVDHARFIGQNIETAFPPLTDTEVPTRYRKTAAAGVSWTTEQIVYEHDEIAGAYQVCAVPTWPGSMAAIFLDVTATKRLEASLMESNA